VGTFGAVYKQRIKGPFGISIPADYRLVQEIDDFRMKFEVITGPAQTITAGVIEPSTLSPSGSHCPARPRFQASDLEEWTLDGVLLVEVLGRVHLLEMAHRAFVVAKKQRPGSRLTLRRGTQVMGEWLPRPLCMVTPRRFSPMGEAGARPSASVTFEAPERFVMRRSRSWATADAAA
jgi:hypothetical protein